MRSRAHIKSHPIHPMLVALPIGLWLGSFVFEEIPPDTYRLEVALGDRAIAIESLPIGR